MSLSRRLSRRLSSFARRHGAPATLRVVTGEQQNPDLTRTPTYADHPCRIIFDRRVQATREGALIQLETQRAILPAATLAAGVTPDTRSLLVVDGDTYQVVTAEPSAPGLPLIAWELELRR